MKFLHPILAFSLLIVFLELIVVFVIVIYQMTSLGIINPAPILPTPVLSPVFLSFSPTPTSSPLLSPSPSPILLSSPSLPPFYPDPSPPYKETLATVFWVGEAPTQNNAFIPNDKSAWDSSWQKHFGGVDDPEDRCGYQPCAFIPEENPFYFALPYNDLNSQGQRKKSASDIPWFTEKSDRRSVLKNSWLAIAYRDQVCYAQWEDVGPYKTNDFAYVFGKGSPSNTFGLSAGLDISPAVRDCLKMTSNDTVSWKFMADKEVPLGPWKKTVTTSDLSW